MDRSLLPWGKPLRALILLLVFMLLNCNSIKILASDARLTADEAVELFMQHPKIQSLSAEQRADVHKSASIYAIMRPSALFTATQTDLFDHAPSAEGFTEVVRVCLARKKVALLEDWLRSKNFQHKLMPWEMMLKVYRASGRLGQPQQIFSWLEEHLLMTHPVDWVRVTKCLCLMASLEDRLEATLGWFDQESISFLRPYPDLTLKVLKLYRNHPFSLDEAGQALFSNQPWQGTTLDQSSQKEVIPIQEARKRVANLENFLTLHKRIGAAKTQTCIAFLQNNDLVQKCHSGFTAVEALDLVAELDGDTLQEIFDDLSLRGLIYDFWETQNILIMLKTTQELGVTRHETLDWFLQSPWKSVAKMAWAIRFVLKYFAHSPETLKRLEVSPEGRAHILRCENSFGVLDLIHRLAQESRTVGLFPILHTTPCPTEAPN